MVQQELELLRTSSGDRDLVDHIKGLEEQLATKSQELRKHRATHLYMQEIKVLIEMLVNREILNNPLKKLILGKIF